MDDCVENPVQRLGASHLANLADFSLGEFNDLAAW